ncbi:unnamed protein product [Penicillium glandicola]
MESSAHAVAGSARAVDPIITPTSTRSVRGQTRTKKADISWSPRDMPNGLSHKWPTFVGEVAWSERRTKLHEDMKFWLDDPNSTVNAAITISILREKIMVESWERGNDKPPSPTQRIEILRNPRPGCSRINGRLEIQFSDVCLRDARAGESNFILTETDMAELAGHIWTYQYPTG